MEKASKELLRDFVNSQHFTNTTDILNSMKDLFSDVLQQVMEAELEETLGYEKSGHASENTESGKSKNYRNGYSKKTVKTQLGEVDVQIPRDRNGEYEPKIIGKYSRNADGMEEKILALYACGMSQRDISEQIKSLYDVEISDGLVSKIVEKVTPEVNAWQNRPLESVYPFIFMDAIHYKVKELALCFYSEIMCLCCHSVATDVRKRRFSRCTPGKSGLQNHSHSREGACFFVIMCTLSSCIVHIIHVFQAFHNVFKIFVAEM